MADQAARLGAATLTRYAEIVHTALIEMRGTTSPRLVLELLCARMQLPDAAADTAALLQRLERLERRATASRRTPDRRPPRRPPRGAAAPATAHRAAAAARRDSRRRPKAAPSEAAPEARSRSPAAQRRAGTRSEPPPDRRQRPAACRPAPTGELDAVALRNLWPRVLERQEAQLAGPSGRCSTARR